MSDASQAHLPRLGKNTLAVHGPSGATLDARTMATPIVGTDGSAW